MDCNEVSDILPMMRSLKQAELHKGRTPLGFKMYVRKQLSLDMKDLSWEGGM